MKKKTYPIHPDDYGCLYYDEEGNFNPPWKQYDYISLKHFKRGFGPEPSFWPHPLEKASHINFKNLGIEATSETPKLFEDLLK